MSKQEPFRRLDIYTSRGKGTITVNKAHIGGGFKNFTQEEADAYKKAKLYMGKHQGHNYNKALEILESAGFEVLKS